MKINKKEKILISMILFIVFGFSYYNFVYLKQKDKIEKLNVKKVELENKYNETIDTIKHIEQKQEKTNELMDEMNLKASEFYPEIIQEKIILELDQYIKDSKLEGNISFDEVVVDIVEPNELIEDKKKNTTFEPFVNEYNGLPKNNDSSQKQNNSTNNQTSSQENNPTVQHIKTTITYKGIYTSVKDFIYKIEKNGKNVAITDLTTSAGLNGELTGNINLEFYAIPKINNENDEYLEWTLTDTYGKQMPFIVEKPVEIKPESLGNIQTTNTDGDFSMILKSSVSDLPSVLISKVGDVKNESAISTKNKHIENIEFEFNKIEDKYYYKYKTSTNIYPKQNTSKGMEFNPKQEKIIIDILSEARVGVDDKSGVKVTVKNNTDKLVEFVVSNDDLTNPRVNVIGQDGKVTMTKK